MWVNFGQILTSNPSPQGWRSSMWWMWFCSSKEGGTDKWCDFAAVKREDLKSHVEVVNRDRDYPCDECNFAAVINKWMFKQFVVLNVLTNVKNVLTIVNKNSQGRLCTYSALISMLPNGLTCFFLIEMYPWGFNFWIIITKISHYRV